MKHYIRSTISILLLILSIGFLIFTIANLFVTLCLPSQKYELPANKNVIDLSYMILVSQVGVKEKTGHNDGVQIKKYLASVGLPEGYAYCAATQYYCFKEAALYLKSVVPIKRTAVVQEVFEDAMKRGKQVPYKVSVHSLLLWRLGYTRSGHEARIIKDLGMGWVYTIEGNTSSYNAREGNGVYSKKRHVTNPLARMKVRGMIGFK
jgi:hypothetical protein